MNDSAKKEGKFSFRCSDDKKTIEVYNKVSDKFIEYHDCGAGECRLVGNLPKCFAEEVKQEEPETDNPFLLIAAIVLLIILWRRR